MHIAATVPLPASPQPIWRFLQSPAIASDCVPGLRRWETGATMQEDYRLWFNWRDVPDGIPVLLSWQSLTPYSSLSLRAEVVWGNTAVPVQVAIQLQPTSQQTTDLHFQINLDTDNKLLMQMAANLIPKTADAFFSCMKKQLTSLPPANATV